MPTISINGHRCHYQLDGPKDAPLLALGHALGASLEMWDANLPALTPHFRVLRYDLRGLGGSEATAGDYSMDLLGQDLLALLDALGAQRFDYCGLSMGGLLGQWLALNAGPGLRRVALCATAARIGTVESWETRIATVRTTGLGALADTMMQRWFTPAFAAAQPDTVAEVRRRMLATDPQGYISCCRAVSTADFRSALNRVRIPVLVIAGQHDSSTTVADAEALHAAIGHGQLQVVDAAHLCNIGARAAFDAALLRFLGR